jgi:hypothetical protein
MLTFVPAPGAVSTTSRMIAEHRPQPLVHIDEADVLAVAVVLRAAGGDDRRVHADPVVLDRDVALGAGVTRFDAHHTDARLAGQAVPDRVLDQRLQAQERQPTGSTSGAICSRTCSRSPNRARSMVR